ncbi:MAG: lipoprotein [Alphaproteobacteria bacterium]|jgi:hypothetical protein|nr:lipoprotein [Alphaproteobacteria bacterium]MBP9878340.1 lipoprotein [Alphaproteobacteria bacterium]
MKKIVLTAAAVAVLSACTHTKMEVTKATDSNMVCHQIAAEMTEVKMVRQGIDDKTGFSGRNVFYGLFFWPAVIVNEVNGNGADKLAQERHAKLVSLYEQKKCNASYLTEAEKRAEAKRAAEAKKQAEENKESFDRK